MDEDLFEALGNYEDEDWDGGDNEYDPDQDVNISDEDEDNVMFEEEAETDLDSSKEMTNKITPEIMFDYEKTNLLAKRKDQLDKGHPSTMEEDVLRLKIRLSRDIAKYEFENGKLPKYYIIRRLDKGYYEKWSHEDFKYFPL